MKQFCSSSDYKSNNGKSLRPVRQSDVVANNISSEVDFDILPNPFDNFLTVNYDLNQTEWIDITMSNSLGQMVKAVVNQTIEAGNHQVHIPTEDLATGTYFITLRTKAGVQTKKVIK
jgi:phosphatidate phosphatase APP1